MSTVLVRREQVVAGMVVHSSHGYRLLVTQVDDSALRRHADRHIRITGHLHADPKRELRHERYPASSFVLVEEL